MSYLKRIFSFVFSRQMLAFVALILAAASIWFVGPLLAFGELRPLESVVARVTVIVMLLALLLCWLLRWSASIVGVAALCLLLWHAGPLLAVGEAHPLAPSWSRVLLISIIVLSYALYGLYRLWQAMRTNDALLKRILHPSADKPDAVARDEIRAVNTVVTAAIAQLKRMRSGSVGVRRLFENKRYLYELPWYMVIGTPGAGKTTAILNSGLQFPLAEQMGAASLKGAGGTKNCDWWFTNETVLIDTAGRYTDQNEQKSAQAAGMNAAEWHGFLGLLRKHRPRAPINGALLTISVTDLLDSAPAQRTAMAAAMRARLGELRQQLGIRFPVYVMVTKLDLLPGFTEYFQSLTAEGRTQVWGFTLPYQADAAQADQEGLRKRCTHELRILEQRLEDGMNNRQQEEYENDRRKKLYALPQEFRSLSTLLVETLDLVFLDSRYDDTQLHSTLRGVYFTSAAQSTEAVAADRTTLFQRLRRGLARMASNGEESAQSATQAGSTLPTAHRSYFLHNLFQQLIIPEAHLVRPNLRWEFRFRLLRMVGHVLSIVLFIWLASALLVSFDNNHGYLAAIAKKTDALAARVQAYRKSPQNPALPEVLSASRALPEYQQLDLESPGGAYRFGLYTAPGVIDASDQTYANLLHQMLLPQIVRRIETALGEQLSAGDADAAYRTLSIYLMLYDKSRFDAKAIKTWVLRDWERSDSGAAFGDRNVMAQHLDALFVDAKPVVPQSPQNAGLVQRARAALSSNPAPSRLYERAKAAMEKEAPEDFTLVRAVGPQAAAVFTLAGNASLDRGVPGLYTYDGYHEVFTKRLPEFLAQAQTEDAWVMGRTDVASKVSSALQNTGLPMAKASLAEDIRRQYLTDYGNYWQRFLADIRPVSAGNAGTMVLDLQTLRTLAAPDSPLVRLARAAVHETSLSMAGAPAEEPSLADAALSAVRRKSRAANAAAGAADLVSSQRPQQKLEKELVDNRFAALREVVTGQADTGSGPALANAPVAVGGKALQLDAVLGLLNEQYTRLVVAENALSTNTMPPAADIGTTLRMEAEKLPAPLRAVLTGISERTAHEVNRGVGTLLAVQVESSVGQACRRAIEGKYPFAASSQEVDIEDFNRIFAADGLLDAFFQKSLASYVDTGSKPWRYKAVSPGMPAIQGPSLEPFQRAAAIREVFFRDPGAKRMAWKMDVKIASVDPEITELLIDIDGRGMRYTHGPVTPFAVSWPGPRGGAMAEITANPRVRPETSTMLVNGPWALFRLIERGRIVETASASRLAVDLAFDGRHAVLDLITGGQANPLTSNLLKGFQCPKGGI